MNHTTRYLIARIAFLVVGLFLFLLVPLTVSRVVRADSGVLYVSPTVQGSGDCSGWTNVCTLQTALTQAQSGDELWVKAGIYYPGAAGNPTATFTLKNGVALYGGFTGTETQRTQRDWEAHLTILSGDIDGDDITTDGVVTYYDRLRGENAYHVVTASGTDATAILDGFIITAGRAWEGSGSAELPNGGGMISINGSPTLANLTFSGNFAIDNGGGLYSNGGNPSLTQVTFAYNEIENLTGRGAGMFSSGNPALAYVTFDHNQASGGSSGGMYSVGDPTLDHVTFSENWSFSACGGMSNNGAATLTDVMFYANTAFGEVGGIPANGGGLCDHSGSGGYPTLTRVVFSDNTAAGNGGGMWSWGTAVLTDVSFSDNSTGGDGGGMYTNDYAPTLTNVTFSDNSAGGNGGGISVDISDATLVNVTLSENSADGNGGGMFNAESEPVLTNVTFAGNAASSGGGLYTNGFCEIGLVNVIIADSVSGGDCVNENEATVFANHVLIEDADHACGLINDSDTLLIGYDPYLRSLRDNGGATMTRAIPTYSPATDKGSDEDCPATDQRGMARPQDGNNNGSYACDIGAYELSYEVEVATYASTNMPEPGEVFTYTISLINVGFPISGGILSDTLPAGINFIGPVTLDPPGAGTAGSAPPLLASNLTITSTSRPQILVRFLASVSPEVDGGTVITNTPVFSSPLLLSPRYDSYVLTVKGMPRYLYLPLVVRDLS